MIHSWWKNAMLFDQMHHWVSAIDKLKDKDPAHLRYLGMTIDSEVTARHYQDASRRSGLVSAFYSYLARN
jgi:hypothetical protein